MTATHFLLINSIVAQVTDLTDLTREEILGRAHSKRVASVRHAAMWTAIKSGASFTDVAHYFDRHHTSVMYAYRKAQALYGQGGFNTMAALCRQIEVLFPLTEEVKWRMHRVHRRPLPVGWKDPPLRYRERWTLTESAVVEALKGLGCTHREIARALGRSRKAVISHGFAVKGGWRGNARLPLLGPEYDAELQKLWAEGLSVVGIAEVLWASRRAVKRRIGQLKLRHPRTSANLALMRRIVQLKREMTQTQIAVELGCRVGSVAGYLHRARKMEAAQHAGQ